MTQWLIAQIRALMHTSPATFCSSWRRLSANFRSTSAVVFVASSWRRLSAQLPQYECCSIVVASFLHAARVRRRSLRLSCMSIVVSWRRLLRAACRGCCTDRFDLRPLPEDRFCLDMAKRPRSSSYKARPILCQYEILEDSSCSVQVFWCKSLQLERL